MSYSLPLFVPMSRAAQLTREAQANALGRMENKLRLLRSFLPDDDEEAIKEVDEDIKAIESLLEEICQELTNVAA